MIYPVPTVQQPQIKYLPNMIPLQQTNLNRVSQPETTKTLEITLYNLKNRTIQIFLDLLGLTVVYVAYAIIINSMVFYFSYFIFVINFIKNSTTKKGSICKKLFMR